MKIETIHLYEERPEITLTTYLIQDSTEMLNGGSRPGVIICPGGAYYNLSDREGEPIALRFATMGYHAFVLKYSNYTDGENGMVQADLSAPIAPRAEIQYPAAMRDIAAAVLKIREHAAGWLVDTDHLAICGFSAGAHNCMMYATHWDKPVLYDHFHSCPEALRPAAVILGYTISDFLYMKEHPASPDLLEAMMDNMRIALTGTISPSDELLKELSPARNISGKTPPTFIWATAEDGLIPVQHSLLLAHALADHHIPFELHIFEKGPHGLSEATQASAPSLSSINPDVAKWVDLCTDWLIKRFALNLPALNHWEQMGQNLG